MINTIKIIQIQIYQYQYETKNPMSDNSYNSFNTVYKLGAKLQWT